LAGYQRYDKDEQNCIQAWPSMRLRLLLAIAVLLMSTLGCGFVGGAFGGSAPTVAVSIATLPPVANAAASTPLAATQPADQSSPNEALLITSPLSGQGVRDSIRVEGWSDPPLGQQLGILVRGEKGEVIATGQAKLQTDASQHGKFSADVSIAGIASQAGRVVVYATSARDGGLVHLSSVEIQLNQAAAAASGAVNLNQPESIVITAPAANATLRGSVQVSGFSDPTFEQTLIVEVRGAGNSQLARETTPVNAAAGQRGSFSVNVVFHVSQAQAGRIVVYALSARDGKTTHLSSIEVNLQP
jgi:hypothetical protein